MVPMAGTRQGRFAGHSLAARTKDIAVRGKSFGNFGAAYRHRNQLTSAMQRLGMLGRGSNSSNNNNNGIALGRGIGIRTLIDTTTRRLSMTKTTRSPSPSFIGLASMDSEAEGDSIPSKAR